MPIISPQVIFHHISLGSSSNPGCDHTEQHNLERHMNDPDKDILNSCRTVHSNLNNITLLGHSTKIPGHATFNTPAPPQCQHWTT